MVESADAGEPQNRSYRKRLTLAEAWERIQEQGAAEIQRTQLETAKLQQGEVLRASFRATADDIRLLNRFVDAGGQIWHEAFLADKAAKQSLDALWRVKFVQTVIGDCCVGTGFLEITHAGRAFLEGANPHAAALQQRRLESSEKPKAKTNRPPTKTEVLRNQRIKFCCPRIRRNPKPTWSEISLEYQQKYPKDKTAYADTLQKSHDRNCEKCQKVEK